MAEEVALALGQLRRKRGVTRSSITRLVNRLNELEATADQPATPGHAQQLLSKLNDLDSSFKELHMQIIDKLEDGDTLEQEQIALDKHDDDIAAMTARLHRLMEPIVDASIKGNGRERRSISLKISRIEKGLKVMEEQMADLVGDADSFDISIVQQCQEQLSDYKKDLAALYSDIIDLEPKDDDELFAHHSKIETALFDCSHKIKKLINSQLESTASVASGTGVKLPKIDVPTFDGNLLHWRQFWEQFSISVHDCKSLTNSEKLVYLQHALKGGSAKNMIEGLSQSGPFITSMLELKLDATTQFEWQKHSQSEAKVPHYQDLLDLRAQASEGSAIIAVKKPYHNFTSEKKFITPGKPLTSFTSHHAADKQVDSNLAEVKVSTSTAVRLKSNLLLMTCRIVVYAPDGSSIEARALLDSASSASFVSERLAQGLCLPRFRQNVRFSGIGDFSHDNPVQHISSFKVSAVRSSVRKIGITAIVVPKVTCDLPTYHVRFDSSWKHLTNLVLADPNFRQPGKIDLLLGADLFADVLCQGRRSGPAGSPVAFETEFGWVLSGRTESIASTGEVAALHTIVGFKDDILRKFWEIEEGPTSNAAFSLEERSVLSHFKDNHFRTEEGFMVSLPKRLDAKQIGESRTQAVRRFCSLERSLNAKGLFQDFSSVMTEYMDLGHAELVPLEEMEKPTSQVFYLPMHVVYKNSSTTTKIRAVFDASAKSSSGV
ncbi:hypothetical protein EMCRGX_G030772 [Ephydatia muelleri]